MSQNPGPVLREETEGGTVVSLEDTRQRKTVDALTRAHGEYLHALARKLCRSQLDPDDLVQDVLERTLRSPIPPGANERAWLSRVMSNLFIDKIRRRNARREDPIEVEPAHVAPEPGQWWQSLTAADIRAQLSRLPAEQRETFELFAFESKSYDEIAAALGIAKATVGTRILRARQKIRELLAKERGDA